MFKRIKKRWKAIKALINSEEYFLTVANQKNPYGEHKLGPIQYEYFKNTNRGLFFTFIKDHIKNLNLNTNE